MPKFEVMISARQYVTVEVENEDDAIDYALLNFDDENWEIDGAEICEM